MIWWLQTIATSTIVWTIASASENAIIDGGSCLIQRDQLARKKQSFIESHARDEGPCNTSLNVPNPYSSDYLGNVFDVEVHPDGGRTKFEGLEVQLQTMFKRVDIFEKSCSGKNTFKKLVKDGLKLNHFGMDFTEVYKKRFGQLRMLSGTELEKDKDVTKLLDVFYPTRVSRFIQRVDFPSRFSGYYSASAAFGLSTTEAELFHSFKRDGFVIIDQWPDIDMTKHTAEATDRLAHFSLEPSSSDAHMHVHTGFALFQKSHKSGFLRMSTLDPIINPKSLLMRLSSAYLAAPAEAHSMSAFKLRGDATKLTYGNGPWHVDGCGTRLKAWIFHNDVDDHTHPTVIAAGTQNNHWFPSVEYFVGNQGQNKLNPSLITKEFGHRLHKMLGRRGGGFIFDTNTIHGADMAGKHKSRETTLIELSTKEHMTLPREPRGPDDGYLSGWTKGLCPASGDR